MEFTSFDGKTLHVHEWLDAENPRGIVQIVHGMGEHGGRYQPLAEYLNAHGYLAFADDHRGHGLTDQDTLGYCAGDMFRDTVLDEGALTSYYAKRFPELPRFVFGHSYGSFLTQRYLELFGERISGAVIAGSNRMDGPQVKAGLAAAKLANALGREKEPGKFIAMLSFGLYSKKFPDGQWVSHDPENNRRYLEDPFCNFTCSNRFYEDMFRGLGTLYTEEAKRSLRKDLPLYLIAGQEDPVGDMGRGMERLCAFYKDEAGVEDVTLRLLPGFRHEFVGVAEGNGERFGEIVAFYDRAGERGKA